MKDVPAIFGSMVFNDDVMRSRLPKETYKELKRTIAEGRHLELDIANVVANAMKDWAIEKGVTHFTHWFQPMTGITAEKHDSFIRPDGEGKIIMEFSGKSLVKGEPDASSFPSGGLRATFEARGYTAWDPTSYAFIKENVLCIPTAFCSYGGHSLDKKTPLLRSIDALNKQTLRILRLFGNDSVKSVKCNIGPEQEYFLIDKQMYLKRADLMYTGRTLFGARPPKGQEMEDHYFGVIKRRVSEFMKDLDEELWKLGIYAKTEHNETAPAQHELAPVFSSCNTATDHNQLTMELMKSIAAKHDLACLLHEKPFEGVNGSGKHDNWSIATDADVNLFKPGATPSENIQFLLFLVAVIKAIDEYQELLRVSVATAGNDHRLGGSEAPPAIVSMFVGEEISDILDAIETGSLYKDRKKTSMEIGASVLPRFMKDTTDRNRTSPFAFTGNKFEFRMLGSSLSVSDPNTILNTIFAEELRQFADELENSNDFDSDVMALIKKTITEHKRIIFNGNGYDESWVEEAKRRGLKNLKSTPDALPEFVSKKSIDLFTRHGVFTEEEMISRYEILLGSYSKTINIEALTMIDMVYSSVLPAAMDAQKDISKLVRNKKELGIAAFAEADMLERISSLTQNAYKSLKKLEEEAESVRTIKDSLMLAKAYCERVLKTMNELRSYVDELERIVGKKYWPLPTYAEMLYSVNE
ncbi:MAG: glutamine synthetase III [Christensenellaceae bacterium]|nr:glutamine synthetase III [Christensenellaceae bacterium]